MVVMRDGGGVVISVAPIVEDVSWGTVMPAASSPGQLAA